MKVLNDRLIDDIRKSFTCPISRGVYEPIRMTRQGFIKICTIQLNLPFSWPNKAFIDTTVCGNCRVRREIEEGTFITPPPGIDIVPKWVLITERKLDIALERLRPKKEKERYKEP